MGQEILFTCPFCRHHKPKLSINTESFAWKCWVCDEKGRSVFSLLWRIGDKERLHAYKRLFSQPTKPVAEQSAEEFRLHLPPQYVALSNSGNLRALRYLQSRKIEQEKILHYKIGVCIEGEYRSRIIFPSFAADGTVNFFTGRTLNNDYIKYMNPPTPRGYKSTIVLNELNVDWSKPLYLVEGFLDMMRIGGNTVPLFGSTLLEDTKLFTHIVLNHTEVYVCLDADARRKQMHLIESLLGYGVQAYHVDISPHKDIAEMTEVEFWDKVSEAAPMSPLQLLRKRIRS